jgi:UPF0042 nucleotide-binding protein
MRIILITGISGSGKSVALNALEDGGYYCVDNLPPRFLPELADYLAKEGQTRLAVAIDARSSHSLDDVPAFIRKLSDLAEYGHQIDTSNLRANVLRAWVKRFVETDAADLTLMFESFGFKRGVPLDADLVFDVRTLPNPYYDRELRPFTGLDKPIIDFLSAQPLVGEMIDDIGGFVGKWLPRFRDDNRSYLTVAIGCTGGQHRSVFIAEALAARFCETANVIVRHRDAPIPAG